MYATCLFCNSALGANEVIEHFPIGRRLAYDEATGRLWVVCQACERWNLSPIETRWEAIEEAERLFRGTKMRVVSDNIGLARLRDGTELVRIGKPPKIELAVWRYGDQFGKRQRRTLRTVGLSTTGSVAMLALVTSELWAGSLAVGTVAALTGAGTFLNMAISVGSGVAGWKVQHTLRATVRTDDGTSIRLTALNVREMAFVRGGRDFDWKLKVPRYLIEPSGPISRLLGVKERAQFNNQFSYLHGDAAVRALTTVLPHLNRDGAGKRGVRNALAVVNDATSLKQLLQQASTTKTKNRSGFEMDDGLHHATLGGFPAPMRLALEMALHEEDERRAMEGELHLLEARWREADAIARIADQLLLPPDIEEQLSSMREKHPASSAPVPPHAD